MGKQTPMSLKEPSLVQQGKNYCLIDTGNNNIMGLTKPIEQRFIELSRYIYCAYNIKGRFMGKHFIVLVVLLFIFSLSACSSKARDNTNYIQNEFSMEFLSFEELVKRSSVAVVAEYVETIRHDNYVEHKFLVKECLYGNVDEKEIYLYYNIGTVHVEEIDYEYSEDASIYEKHTDYVLILEKLQSIFYEHDRYMLDADVLLDDSNKEYRMYSNPVELPEGVTIREYVCSLHEAIQHQEDTANKSAVYDDEYEEMMGESIYVGRVSILEMVNEGKVHNGNVYRCKVEELIKGDKLETYEDGTILITIVKDRVSVGNKYVIGFNPADEHSVIYVQSTLSGIYND